MTISSYLLRAARCAPMVLAAVWVISPLQAQEANVLGLPAIPQPKPGSMPPATPATSSANSGASGKSSGPSTTPNSRAAITGELGLQHSARDGIGRIIYTTKAVFQTAGSRSDAMEAAKSVQLGLPQSCLKQCQPVKMPAPKILSSGQLEFELAFKPLHQTLSQAQFVAVLQSKPLELTTAQLAAPVAVVAPPQINVQAAPAMPAATPSTPPLASPSK